MKFRKALIAFLLIFFSVNFVSAQVPNDLSQVRSDQITDAQLQQYLSRAKSNGYSQQEVEAEFLRRGMPETELVELRRRIKQMETSVETPTFPSSEPATNTKRKVQANPAVRIDLLKPANTSRLFGADLFSNENLSFEPDLRMATPKNYTIGPDDELLVNIYGQNMSQQTLKVTPEGTVNVKYAGVIQVNGMTVEAATLLLKNRLSKYYPGLSNGQTKLQLSLGSIRSIKVILIGAINRPGTYTLPSLATLFNALYVSGGPAENGSFRNIELIRNSKVIQVADLYDFLVRGDQRGNVSLEDNDVIRVPFAKLLVTFNGELNRPGIFELRPSETLEEAIEFAGGFKSKAFRGRITGKRYTDFGRSVIDIPSDSFGVYKAHNGDEFVVDSVLNRYVNRVIINGAVFKPGTYALEAGMTISDLINKAQGLKEDVYSGRAIVVRTRTDLTREYMSVELKPILAGLQKGMTLVKEDSIHIASIFDLKDTISVTINGAVRKPGTFRFEDSLSLKSLILKAGGYAENATGNQIEISRRKHDVDVKQSGSAIADIITINDNMDLSEIASDIILKPYDIITIKEDPYYKKQISVKISGEVLMPAVYTLQSREERLSSIIQRSGGLLYTSNVRGAKLMRQKREIVDTAIVKRLLISVKQDSTATSEDSSLNETKRVVAIDLDYILKHPGSADDIILEDGDELIVPRINNTVSIYGEVYKPVDIMYERQKKMKDYLSDAGGVTQLGKRRKAFVIYANGSASKIERMLGIFPRQPKIYPGSSIFVPQKPKRDGQFDAGRAGILVSAITALITAVALFTK
ncbi:SLBB domain-containing protein [Flavihumibacter solisilvae]|uniref:Capsule biosynthesis protein n=1 Tax=Flavihumibacter solisilvae TaxID=1349421 RepID=A0A0C1KZV7_9BACT|nr:SLBB domain-containing protein [Flavihumibacter solisilvae]KIC92831.1 hypothetical protein OI18_20640 [Flavihumibacter solisilvae]